MDVTDSSTKMTLTNNSLSRHSLNRSLILKRSRQIYSHQYFRRKSNPKVKAASMPEEKLCFDLASHLNSETGNPEAKSENEVCERESVEATPVLTDNFNVPKTVCGICQRVLKRRPNGLENALSSSEISVVAVLVCGHVYHAECLEQKTCRDHQQDPPCPACTTSCANLNPPGESTSMCAADDELPTS